MKLTHLLALPASLLTLLTPALAAPEYYEHLHLLPLSNDYLYAGFNFTSTTSLSAYESHHYRYFPRSLGQILQYTRTSELHLRFALGRWDDESWGARPRDGGREGGTGVELWAWIDGDGGGQKVEERWGDLVNSLSGLFCASLNFIDGTRTVRPVLSFESEGTSRVGGRVGQELLHGTLPNEVVCTENLTPFLKLLPCKGKSGISSLLDGHKVFDANWQAMSIDVRPVCPSSATSNDDECMLEIQQTIDVVLDIERSMRPRDDPIPRPRPIEEIECDESKHYNGPDSCYPKRKQGAMGWSLSKIFGTPVLGSCHLVEDDTHDSVDITLEVPSARVVETSALQLSSPVVDRQNTETRHFKLQQGTHRTDLTLPYQPDVASTLRSQPPLYATRQITGHGQERGGMHTLLHNPHPYPQTLIYLEALPWFLRPYMHTLKISHKSNSKAVELEKMFYTPAIDRKRATKLEVQFTVPASTTLELTYDFEKAVLRYTEYPPDANRGFDIAAAVIRILPQSQVGAAGSGSGSKDRGSYIRTTSLLLPLPTPDFSMPYNVIILTSTVIALGFGSILNLVVRRFVLVGEVPRGPLHAVAARVRGLIGTLSGGDGKGGMGGLDKGLGKGMKSGEGGRLVGSGNEKVD
ncbi:Subunit of the glycosylphosphatidylinositol transamidase complex-like protein [Recurvomyces mirabilis]|nr:Subunit of the glycosylphosphatidylinositol transamidase complex-like protein [Recurvomyces mirabilis]